MANSIPSIIPSIETLKKWIDYWRRFKGKRVKIFLKSGMNVSTDVHNFSLDTSIKTNFLDTVIGTIEDVVESPFGIWLKDVSIPEEKEVEGAFIPMSEIARIYSLRKKVVQG
ncbi:MAG: hypothetical protein ABSB28_10805 [Candidatus Bathyarchaeia archaeon]